MELRGIKSILLVTILFISSAIYLVHSEGCSEDLVYGENDIIDQLLICSVGKSFDLDLTPRGEQRKGTSKALIEQGLSNKTAVVFAKLSGLWSTKRTSFIDTAWRCESNKTLVNAIVELSGLNLEMVEKFDVPLHRNQQKLSQHKPCKTFDLPLWLCRQSKPIYRTTRTWVNRAFFNLTLVQASGELKPSLESLSFMFTCPDTFRQKITHSPSAMYIISKIIHSSQEPQSHHVKRDLSSSENRVPLPHPVSFSTNQDGKGPASPPYHNFVNLINNQLTETLSSAIDSCIGSTDCDLSLMRDFHSFRASRNNIKTPVHSDKPKTGNECSSKQWLVNRLQLHEESSLSPNDIPSDQPMQNGHFKRSQFKLSYPKDPNQLLDPFSHYHDDVSDRVVLEDGDE